MRQLERERSRFNLWERRILGGGTSDEFQRDCIEGVRPASTFKKQRGTSKIAQRIPFSNRTGFLDISHRKGKSHVLYPNKAAIRRASNQLLKFISSSWYIVLQQSFLGSFNFLLPAQGSFPVNMMKT